VNTDVVSRTGLVPEVPEQIPPSPAEALELAVERVLAAVRPGNLTDPVTDAHRAEESLRDTLSSVEAGPDHTLDQAVACVEAACEHLRYCEWQEARLLLVAARGQLVRSQTRRT
jgi:hypothetical protein